VKVWCISPGFLATGLAGVGAQKLKEVSSGIQQYGDDKANVMAAWRGRRFSWRWFYQGCC
jgi:hypothetical protein